MRNDEWRVEAMPTHGWRVVDATGQEIVADVYRKEDAVTIVADHHAAQMQAGLVEALRDMVDLWARGQKIINGAPRNVELDSQVIAARAVLKAAGGR